MSPPHVPTIRELRPTNGWDPLASLGHPSTFQRVSRLGSVTARHSNSGRQPNFAALNRRRHLYSAGRPSRWALAHILVLTLSDSGKRLIPVLWSTYGHWLFVCYSVRKIEYVRIHARFVKKKQNICKILEHCCQQLAALHKIDRARLQDRIFSAAVRIVARMTTHHHHHHLFAAIVYKCGEQVMSKYKKA